MTQKLIILGAGPSGVQMARALRAAIELEVKVVETLSEAQQLKDSSREFCLSPRAYRDEVPGLLESPMLEKAWYRRFEPRREAKNRYTNG